MIPVAINNITADHIRSLIADGVREGRTIEYKMTLPGGTDSDKKELLADVSSFANASGGDLIYGVAAKEGVPIEIVGLRGFDPDQDVLRLESTIRDSIAPRILNLHTAVVECSDNKHVLVIRIGRSWSGPHMVTFKGNSRFFARSSAGKFQMDVDELRSAFALSGDLPSRIRAWRDDRIARIVAGNTPVQLSDAPKMILHLVPTDSFDDNYRISAEDFSVKNANTSFQPIGASGWNHRINLDGYVTHSGASRSTDTDTERSYCQIFRSGRLESVCSDLGRTQNGDPSIASVWYEQELLRSIKQYLQSLNNFGVALPMVLMLTFAEVRGVRLGVDSWRFDGTHPIDRDILLLPDLLIEDAPGDVAQLMRPVFDAVWNACGFVRSFNYDEQGNWKPR